MDCSQDFLSFTSQAHLSAELRDTLNTADDFAFLNCLAHAALQSAYTDTIFEHFEPLFPELCVRWTSEHPSKLIAAFARILPLAPYLTDLAVNKLSVFAEDDSIFRVPLGEERLSDFHLRETLVAIYRLLIFNNSAFAMLVRPVRLTELLNSEDKTIRCLVVRIFCMFIPASDATLESMMRRYVGDRPCEGPWESRVVDYTFFPLWEQRRLNRSYDLVSQRREERAQRHCLGPTNGKKVLPDGVFSPLVHRLGETLIYHSVENASPEQPDAIVQTASCQTQLNLFGAALLSSDPILITGPAGSGKTSIIRHGAQILNQLPTMVTLHLNEQSDMKLLTGNYSSGSTPGSFQWQPGVLTKAVEEGRWLLIEDLDRAPTDILGAILPLIERRELPIPNRGATIRAANGFRIIATMRSHEAGSDTDANRISAILGGRFWQRIHFEALGSEDLQRIIISRFPLLENMAPRLMGVYESISASNASTTMTRAFNFRPVVARELFKWCRRVQSILRHSGLETPFDGFHESVLDEIFLDAADCFVAGNSSSESKSRLLSTISSALGIDAQRARHLLVSRDIQYQAHGGTATQAFRIGRVSLLRNEASSLASQQRALSTRIPFATDRHTCRLLESVAAAVIHREPVLLVGETGLGKTTAIQHLAQAAGRRLIVINLSQQSESSDLLGGFKPINTRTTVLYLKDKFEPLFESAFSYDRNRGFMRKLSKAITKGQWKRAVTLWKEAMRLVESRRPLAYNDSSAETITSGHASKKRKVESNSHGQTRDDWLAFANEVERLEHQLTRPSESFAFQYIEGKLVQAVRDGDWVLLDEINLASADTLESLSDLLEDGEDSEPSILLAETGTLQRIEANRTFRIFGSMNPATDVGKRDLPIAFRSRFTEIHVNSPDDDIESLTTIIKSYISSGNTSPETNKAALATAKLYQMIQQLVLQGALVDGVGLRPHYSLRTLTRTVDYAADARQRCSLLRALYEGFVMCFCTCLSVASDTLLQSAIKQHLFQNSEAVRRELSRPLREPTSRGSWCQLSVAVQTATKSRDAPSEVVTWVPSGQFGADDVHGYIVTPSILRNLQNLSRALSSRKYPILIQGPTSAGKTSMIEYLAKRTGHKVIRINNHEHTDIQEYLGCYVSSAEGNIVYQDGSLVRALKEGHWVILDELNLAPSDVLEALNRLLDDNREFYNPETQEIVKPHSNFILFATQNPAGPYGGRKVLSRAFRNRFLELHFDDIPVEELNVILAKRSSIPESWCALIVEVYQRLARLRQQERIFERDGFATLRDLFRWSSRKADTLYELAVNGYMLLAEKVRRADEKEIVKEIIQEVMSCKGTVVRLDEDKLYPETASMKSTLSGDLVWTKSLRRMATLVSTAINNNEAVLLVGSTGCGKTSVCQLLARQMLKTLHIMNAHQNTETSDIIGAQRPVRGHAAAEAELRSCLKAIFDMLDIPYEPNASTMSYIAKFDTLDDDQVEKVDSALISMVKEQKARLRTLFEWTDGSLVKAMRAGEFYLLDEISLADDSVLERLNSVLDPQRTILLAEKGGSDNVVVTAKDGFQFFATMNPGGDFGKKELSPALRNRFTEIWIPAISDPEELAEIVRSRLKPQAAEFVPAIVSFSHSLSIRQDLEIKTEVSVRDILAWVDFINASNLRTDSAVVHGAAMVFLDSLGANPSALFSLSDYDIELRRSNSLRRLSAMLGLDAASLYGQLPVLSHSKRQLQIGDFLIPVEGDQFNQSDFEFTAPTTILNGMRILRALQLPRPILLEGNPGVGKTSLVVAIANAIGKNLVRLNLSEQTDLIDLFGTDVPVENGDAGSFTWQDGPLLSAMKHGDWVLLDEMNLASQSVLEGLNACLDHRGHVFISELGKTFERHPSFRLFAAQNPHLDGSGRKGLPKSFVNRFTVVYADVLRERDMRLICETRYPVLRGHAVVPKLVACINDIQDRLSRSQFGGTGSPWEFNLRDILRWFELLVARTNLISPLNSESLLDPLIVLRMRTETDRDQIRKVFSRHFGEESRRTVGRYVNSSATVSQIGYGLTCRLRYPETTPNACPVGLLSRSALYEAMILGISKSWPILLVGSAGSGKSVMIKSLASLHGTEVNVFAMHPDIDSTDLIGGFEQVDSARRVQSFRETLRRSVRRFLSDQLRENGLPAIEAQVKSIASLMRVLTPAPGHLDLETIGRTLLDAAKVLNWSEALKHSKTCDALLQSSSTIGMGRFEWVDGVLIKALQEGRWFVLDNANLCSPSVLDRLNSLLEPNGSLILGESCGPDGHPRIIRPHPSFRIFLTSDPRYGEISRAMRNRAMELFLEPPMNNDSKHAWQFSHLPPVESSLSRFYSILQLERLPFDEYDIEEAVGYELESLSRSDIELYSNFCRQASHGLCSLPISKILSQKLRYHGIYTPLQKVAVEQIGQFWSTRQDLLSYARDFEYVQPLNPVLNPSFATLSHDSRTSSDIAQANARFWDLCNDNMKAEEAVSRRMYVSSGRNSESEMLSVKEMARSKHDLGAVSVISKLLMHFQGVTTTTLASLSVESQSQETFTGIQMLQVYWWSMLGLLSSSALHEAMLPGLLTIGLRLLSQKCMEESGLVTLRETCLEKLRRCYNGHALMSGRSMAQIWSAFQCDEPANAEHLQAILALEQLIHRFDELLWRLHPPLTDIVSLRSSISKVYEMGCEHQVPLDHIHRKLTATLANLSSNIHADDKAIQPYFKVEFEGLCQLFDLICAASLRGGKPDIVNDHSMITILASRSLKARGLTMISGLNQVCDAFGRIAGSENMSIGPIAIKGNLHLLLTNKLVNVGSTPLASLGLLKQEVMYLSQEIAQSLNQFPRQSIYDSVDGLLLEIVMEIAHAHASEFNDIALQELSDVRSWRNLMQLQDTLPNDHQLKEVLTKYFLQREPDDGFSSHAEVAASNLLAARLINCATGCILLYIPDKPFDPAAEPLLNLSFYREQMQRTKRMLKVCALMNRFDTGQDAALRSQMLEDYLESLGPEPKQPKVLRPDESLLPSLFASFQSIRDITFRCQRMLKADSALFDDGILASLDQLVFRLTTEYRVYQDLTYPAICFLHILRLGISLMDKHPAREVRNDASSVAIAKRTPFLQALPGFWEVVHMHNAYYDLHALNVLETYRDVTGLQHWKGQQFTTLHTIFDGFYHAWRKTLSQAQTANAKASTLYRYKEDDEDDPEIIDEEMADMFPNSEEAQSREPPSQSTSSTVSRHSTFKNVVDSHIALFQVLKQDDTSNNKLLRLLTKGTKLMVNAQGPLDPSDYTLGMRDFASALLLMLRDTAQGFDLSANDVSQYNIYLDHNKVELQALSDLIEKILASYRRIQASWPEHATLQNVIESCNKLKEFHIDDPLVKLMPTAERLHTYMSEWQNVASSEFDTSGLLRTLTDTLIKWRQLELATWSRILDAEREKIEDDAKMWWFVAYENVVDIPLSGDIDLPREHVENLIETLDVLLISSTVGQYVVKLRILQALSQHLFALQAKIPQLRSIHASLSNLIALRKHFEPLVNAHLMKERERIALQVSEVIKLASWKDRNVEALRQSFKSSRRTLLKIVRSYRRALTMPASDFMQRDVQWESHEGATTNRGAVSPEHNAEADAACRAVLSIWNARPLRYQLIPHTITKMRATASIPTGDEQAYIRLQTFRTSVLESSLALRKITAIGRSQEDVSSTKHLVSRKRRLLADTLKDLREMGIKANHSVDFLRSQDSLQKLLCRMPFFRADTQNPQSIPYQAMLFQVALIMPKVRHFTLEHHTDLNDEQVGRCVGYLEHLFGICIQQYEAFTKLSSDWEIYQQSIRIMKNSSVSSEDSVFAVNQDEQGQACATRSMLLWLPNAIVTARTILQAQASLGSLDLTDVLNYLQELESTLRSLHQGLINCAALPTGLTTTLQERLSVECISAIHAGHERMMHFISQYPVSAPILEQLLHWATIESYPVDLPPKQNAKITVAEFNAKLYKALDMTLGSIQDLQTSTSALPKIRRESGWLIRESQVLQEVLSALHIVDCSRAVESLLGEIQNLSGDTLKDALNSLAHVLPIFEEYGNICGANIDQFLQLHSNCLETTLRLAKELEVLGNEGFCNPEAKTDERSQQSKLEEGTGLGQGEGAEDISHDIEDDESLSELAEEQNENPSGQPMEAEENAIDIDGNLEGQAEDQTTTESEKDEQNGLNDDVANTPTENGAAAQKDTMDDGQAEDDADHSSDVAEEIGESGPSAVNEKLWDQTDETNDLDTVKDKESDQKNSETEAAEDTSRGIHEDDAKSQDATNQGDEDALEDSPAESDDNETVFQDTMDDQSTYLEDHEGLELPNELQLDGNKDDDMQSLSNSSDDDEELVPPAENVEDELMEDISEHKIDDLSEHGGEPNVHSPDPMDNFETISDSPKPLEPKNRDTLNNNTRSHDMQGSDAIADGAGSESRDDLHINDSHDSNQVPEVSTPLQANGVDVEQSEIAGEQKTHNSEPVTAGKAPKSEVHDQVRQLGSALEKWYREQREIQAADPNQTNHPDKEDEQKDHIKEFQHLNSDEASQDIQALASTTTEQAKPLDHSMAISESSSDAESVGGEEINTPQEDSSPEKLPKLPNPMSSSNVNEEGSSIPTGRNELGSRSVTPDLEKMQVDEDSLNNNVQLDDLEDELSSVNIQAESRERLSEADSVTQWSAYESSTSALAHSLTSYLRLILEPTLATRFRGDFRTGKRLNMKRIIPYIASAYRRDKIWMRRSVPSKRSYQVLLAIDDSKSMTENGSKDLAFECLAVIAKSLTMLEVGKLCVVAFGEDTEVAHDFNESWTNISGSRCLRKFDFQQQRTNVIRLVKESIRILTEARRLSGIGRDVKDLWQLQLIISDGICEDHSLIQRLLLRAQEERILIVFVIVDSAVQQQSILDLEKVDFVPKLSQDGTRTSEMQLLRKGYLETFPFKYYVIVRHVAELPQVLSTALRQWFAEVANQ